MKWVECRASLRDSSRMLRDQVSSPHNLNTTPIGPRYRRWGPNGRQRSRGDKPVSEEGDAVGLGQRGSLPSTTGRCSTSAPGRCGQPNPARRSSRREMVALFAVRSLQPVRPACYSLRLPLVLRQLAAKSQAGHTASCGVNETASPTDAFA